MASSCSMDTCIIHLDQLKLSATKLGHYKGEKKLIWVYFYAISFRFLNYNALLIGKGELMWDDKIEPITVNCFLTTLATLLNNCFNLKR